MIRSGVFLALLAGWTAAHPQCYPNNNPPDADKTKSSFCPAKDYEGDDFLQFGSCCNDLQEAVIEAKYLEAGTLSAGCAGLYKQLLCGQCHSFSAHLFARLGEDLGPWDGMTVKQDFCDDLIDECGDEIDFGGPAEYGGQSYCKKHVGGLNGADEFWSYPYQDPLIVPGELTPLFPDINGRNQFPKWILSLRQSPDASMWWILGIEGEVKKVMANNMASISLVVDISDGDLADEREEGLLDMAFDPEFSSNGYFYLSHSVNLGDTITGPTGTTKAARNRISRFTYDSKSTANTRASEKILLTTDAKDSEIHSAGWIGFKPSAYGAGKNYNELYWTTGDGGPPQDANNNAQDLNNLLGAMIRINVPSFETSTKYQIPSGNYKDVDSSAAPELCAPGLRNPWRCSFDRLNDDLWCGDVGQEAVEEVNIIECGKNYGWSRFEGHSCQKAVENNGFNGACKNADRSGFEWPIYEYCHPDFAGNDPDYNGGVDICGDREINGLAIIGGFVYRGSYFSDLLEGAYVFADQVTRFVYFIKKNDEGNWVSGTIISEPADIFISFEEDINGELYLVSRQWQIYYLPCGDLCSSTCLNQNDQQPSIESKGCYADKSSNRALKLKKATTCGDGETFMSPLICASYCSTINGAVYAGVEAGTDCYCGAAGENFGKHGSLDGDEFCATLCDSDPESTCGGVDAIEVFEIGSAIIPITPAPGGGGPLLTCVNGIVGYDGSNDVGDVCCPLECGQCGGNDCGSNGAPGFGNKQCCINGVLNNQPDCSVSDEAPCVVTDVTPTPGTPTGTTPAPVDVTGEDTCVNGIVGIDGSNDVGDVCCPLECGQCGGDNCGSNGARGFGNKQCCINGVLNNQQDCSTSKAAPCIVTDVVVTPATTPAPVTPTATTPAPVDATGQGTCINGVAGIDGSNDAGDVCCPLECGKCGGDNCGSFGAPGFGNKQCCINGVLNNQPDCSARGSAPCVVTDAVVTPATTPSPVTPAATTPSPVDDTDPKCSNGVPGYDGENEVGRVCCPVGCGQCGDIGCGSSGKPTYDNTDCCVNGVLNNQPDCDDRGAAPCIVGLGPSDPTPGTTPAPFTPVTTEGYLGCFRDDRDTRILADQQETSTRKMDAAFCKASCGQGYDYYGTQYGGECWCGSGTPGATYELYGELPGGDCDSECTGDSSEKCGGRLAMSVYAF